MADIEIARPAPKGDPLEQFTGRTQYESEIATLKVRGQRFEDWETVWVQWRWNDSFPLFRFTCAERDPVPLGEPGEGWVGIWEKVQFRPGDSCTILLGGQQVVTGLIETRQVAYDATNHGVMLIGKGVTAWPAKSSVIHPTNNFDNKNVLQIAKEVWKDYPVGVLPIGQLDLTPFKKCQANQGETTWDFIERLCRPRGVVLGSDEEGNFLLIGQHSFPVVQQLTEGDNILRCNCTITAQWKFLRYDLTGQKGNTEDEDRGRPSSEQRATVKGTAPFLSALLTVAEQPLNDDGEMKARAMNEAKWHETTELACSITVQGWLRDGKKLWKPGDEVTVTSPMAMLNGQKLAIEVCTYTQDRASGTLTTLDLVHPGRLNKGTVFSLVDMGGGKKGIQAVSISNDTPVPSVTTPPQNSPQNLPETKIESAVPEDPLNPSTPFG